MEKKAEVVPEEQVPKKARHRKKQLYTSILRQMEFYFSDSNLAKDRFLSQLIHKNPYVDLEVFLKFNKILKLNTNADDVRKALKKSTLLELSEDGNSVRRKTPVKQKPNEEECTIYVERLKADVTHDWLSTFFSEFGKVDYVSIPKYKHNSAIKGFAFVEFEKAEGADHALAFFESIGCKMPSNLDPSELCSIKTFEKGPDEEKEAETQANKRKLDEVEDVSEPSGKKPKIEGNESDLGSKKTCADSEEPEAKKKKKNKKEHKKKKEVKELGMQVLSKRDWRRMRSRYLDLQRKKMKEFKQYLSKAKHSQRSYEHDKFKKPIDSSETKETVEEESSHNLEIEEGVIVKVTLPEPCLDPRKLKADIKSCSSDVKYVDVPVNLDTNVYVRFGTSKAAQEFCQQSSFGNVEVLEGEIEKTYWNKILNDRKKKSEKVAKKERGRDKLMRKANKMIAKHTKFDD